MLMYFMNLAPVSAQKKDFTMCSTELWNLPLRW